MISDPIIGLDIDGVLADLVTGILDSCVKKGMISSDVKFEDITEWEMCDLLGITSDQLKASLCGDTYRTVGEHFEVVEDVKRWIEMGVPVIYVTARSEDWAPGIKDMTMQWLDEKGLLQGTLGVKYSSAMKKHKVVKKLGINIFVDDHPQTIGLMKGQVRSYLLARPWNQKASPRYEWSDIRRMIDGEINLRRGASSGHSCE